ncbi:hypothetical protein [Streptomyces sp. NPDC091217]|uniref:hypothetical protein n=1 Tax=Streptomyces sp. NPDC091217 TaxID=3365975 RepID=UPI0037FE4905
MTRINDMLSRAQLTRERSVPRDIIPTCAPTASTPARTSPKTPPAGEAQPSEAAEDLRALCETVLTHTPPTDVAQFLTAQVPEPRSALVLACILQLTDTDDGARLWWQFAAGAGQPAAAYCLYLQHLAQGEPVTADWWHQQTDDLEPPPEKPTENQREARCTSEWHPATHPVTSTSTTTILRILRHLSKHTVRYRTAAVSELMAYVPTAVTVGALRAPEMDLPLPGPDFAHHINLMLASAASRPDVSDTLPARTEPRERAAQETDRISGPHSAAEPEESAETACEPMGETATR